MDDLVGKPGTGEYGPHGFIPCNKIHIQSGFAKVSIETTGSYYDCPGTGCHLFDDEVIGSRRCGLPEDDPIHDEINKLLGQ